MTTRLAIHLSAHATSDANFRKSFFSTVHLIIITHTHTHIAHTSRAHMHILHAPHTHTHTHILHTSRAHDLPSLYSLHTLTAPWCVWMNSPFLVHASDRGATSRVGASGVALTPRGALRKAVSKIINA